ncbi:hypothetical protein MTR67_027604 [Solanum verrucosum]|uniref:Uncharacterized protein n=1 Tax=Solanum verrucosum TaxID=315347 RepID=A0AAF0R9X0_SOLVR|nr:hypothetical protein MTR67_027604 [Solanum verrucosum]
MLPNQTQRSRLNGTSELLIFGSFCPILKEKELGFKRRRREEGEEEEKKEEINKIGQDHCGFSSGVIPIKDWAVYLSCDLLYIEGFYDP